MSGSNSAAPKMGLFGAVAVVMGNIVGSGIYLLPSALAAYGMFAIFGWIMGALGIMFIGAMFVYLSSKEMVQGGVYYYVEKMLGRFLGWQSAWFYWFFAWSGNITIAVAAVGYLAYFFPMTFFTENLVVIGILWLFTITTIFGLKTFSTVQIVTTILKVIPLIVVATIGWFYVDPSNFVFSTAGKGTFSALTTVTLITLWAFVGIETAIVVGSRVKNPHKNVPLSIVLGVILIAILYIASTLPVLGILSQKVLGASSSPYAAVADIMIGRVGGTIVTVFVLISCLGAVNGWTLVGAEIITGAAKNGLFPKFLAREAKNSMPATALIFTAIVETLYVAVAMFAVKDKNIVSEYVFAAITATMGVLLPYFYTAISALMVAIIDGKKALGWGLVAVFSLIFSFFLLVSDSGAVYYGVIFMFATTPLYLYTVRTFPQPILGEEGAMTSVARKVTHKVI